EGPGDSAQGGPRGARLGGGQRDPVPCRGQPGRAGAHTGLPVTRRVDARACGQAERRLGRRHPQDAFCQVSRAPVSAFVDTNILVRHLTGDPPAMAARATGYLASADALYLPDLIAAETIY